MEGSALEIDIIGRLGVNDVEDGVDGDGSEQGRVLRHNLGGQGDLGAIDQGITLRQVNLVPQIIFGWNAE